MRNPLLREVTIDDAIDYTLEFLQIVGCPQMFEHKEAIVHMEQLRGELPCDFEDIIQVRDACSKVAFKYASNSFDDLGRGLEPVYKIQGRIIFISTPAPEIEVAYRAFFVDEEGVPMIPDNETLKRALSAYIKKEVYTIYFDQNKIAPQVLQLALRDYAWAVGACETEMSRLSLDKAESLFADWNSFWVHRRYHTNGFRNLSDNEYIIKH